MPVLTSPALQQAGAKLAAMQAARGAKRQPKKPTGERNQSAMDRCKGIGTWECERFRFRIFRRHAWMAQAIASEYLRINKARGHRFANLFLLDFEEMMRVGGTGLFADCDDQAIRDYSEAKAKKSEREMMEFGIRLGGFAAIAEGKRICQAAGLEWPAQYSPSDTQEQRQARDIGAMARLADAGWWRRQVRKLAARKLEQAARLIGQVSKQRGLYVSDFTVNRRRAQRGRNRQLLLDLVAENEEGYQCSLAEASDKGISNPINRRHELMVRIRGYEELAKSMGHRGLFITLTAPSRFHAVLSNGARNPKYEGATPADVQAYLQDVWSRVRAAWAKQGIRVFGFRFVEPHHDGTPHWHLLVFVEQAKADQAEAIFRDRAIEMDRQELCSHTRARFDCVALDPARGGAAAYVAKYVAKNIDGMNTEGESVGKDHESRNGAADVISTAERVEAWASTWGIRQFQQIGSVSVTVWREVRRAKDLITELSDDMLKAISQAAEAQDWALFCELMGGALVKRVDQVIRPLMVLSDKEGKYGDWFKRLRGILIHGFNQMITRIHEWKIYKRPLVAGGQYAVPVVREGPAVA